MLTTPDQLGSADTRGRASTTNVGATQLTCILLSAFTQQTAEPSRIPFPQDPFPPVPTKATPSRNTAPRCCADGVLLEGCAGGFLLPSSLCPFLRRSHQELQRLRSFPAGHGARSGRLEQTCIGRGAVREISLRLGDASGGGSTWGLVPFQTEEGFVRPGGCGRGPRCARARVRTCVPASRSAPRQPRR